jgi:hypothetical protein
MKDLSPIGELLINIYPAIIFIENTKEYGQTISCNLDIKVLNDCQR